MAYLDYDPSLDFDAQETQMLQAAARIKALREKNLMPSASTEEVGGFSSAMTPGFKYAGKIQKTPLLAAAVPLLQDYTTGQMDKELATNRGALTAAQNEALSNWIAGAPKGTDAIPADPGVTPLTPNDDEGNAMPSSPALPAVPAKPPTRQEVMAHAAAGSKIPLARKMAQEYLSDQLIKEPEREETRAARLHERQLVLQQALQKQKDDADLKRWMVGQQTGTQLQVAEINAQARRDAAADRRDAAGGDDKITGTFVQVPGVLSKNGLPVERNNKTGETREIHPPAGQERFEPPPAKLKELPAGVGKAWRENARGIAKVDEALAKLKTSPSATGLTKGAVAGMGNLGQSAVNWWDPGGVEARALVADIGSLVIHERSGATVTAAESPRLRPFIPSATDTADVASKKLRLFKAEYQRMQQEILDYAETQGYKSPADPTPSAPAGNYPPGVDPSKLSIVRSKAERDALPPNTPYLDGSGNLSYTPKK